MPVTNNFKSAKWKWLPSGPRWTSWNLVFRIFSIIKRSFEKFFSAETPDTFSDRKKWLSKLCVCQKMTGDHFRWACLSIFMGPNIILFSYLFSGSFCGIENGKYKANVVLSVRTLRGFRHFEDDQGFIGNFVKLFVRKNSLKDSSSVDCCFWTCVTSRNDFAAKSNIQIWVDWFSNCELFLFSETLPAMAKFCCNYWERSATFSHNKRARVASLVLKRMLVRPVWSASNYSLQWNNNYNRNVVISDFIPSELF